MAPGLPTPGAGFSGSPESTYDDTVYRLALLGLEHGASFPKIDARPHLQYDFTVGNRLRFSCTSYYALQFSNLRKQCGVEETLMRSLERTTTWIAEGGKSKSSFYKTSDDQFILKTLVTAWNVSDL
jgi:1-phosphatidylinositol-3-phosphate 5-kinase